MNYNKLIAFGAALALTCACSYDDSELKTRIDHLESRVNRLEKTCDEVNANVASLKTLVEACDGRDYVVSVTEVKDGDKTGVKITFAKSAPVTIWNGEDGEKGVTPEFGIKKDTDGKYYWTINGEYITYDGKKLPATGAEGATPKLKIENEKWYVSYDNGATWEYIADAVAADAKYFASVTEDNDYVYIKLAGSDTILKLSKAGEKTPLSLTISNIKDVVIAAGQTIEIPFTLAGSDIQTASVNTLLTTSGWAASVTRSSYTEGVIKVTAPKPYVSGQIAVFVSNDSAETIVKFISFVEGTISVSESSFEVEAEGETVIVNVNSNYSDFYFVNASNANWLSCSRFQTKAEAKNYEINLVVAKNEDDAREATINVCAPDGTKMTSFVVKQKSGKAEEGGASFEYAEQVGGRVIKVQVYSYDYQAQDASGDYCGALLQISFNETKENYALVYFVIGGKAVVNAEYQWAYPGYGTTLQVRNVPVGYGGAATNIIVNYGAKKLGTYGYFYSEDGAYLPQGIAYTVVE